MTKQPGVKPFRILWFSLVVLVVMFAQGPLAAQAINAVVPSAGHDATPSDAGRSGLLWQNPVDLASRDLFYGIGGKQDAPPADGYTFVEEDLNNSSPKFVVKDSDGVKWKVKLGPEARGEVAASRLVWAAGYFTDEDYYLPRLQVKDMPQLKRGKDLVSPDGAVENVRMERDIKGQKREASWKWSSQHGRPFNGLKIMMALINNWDLKDNNTAIYRRQTPSGEPEYIYAVTDLGASFGRTHLDRAETKANLEDYEASDFIDKVHKDRVDFATPGGPTPFLLVNPIDYRYRRGMTSLTRDIPRDDARWLGQLLSQLSPQQIRDAFRAGGFSPEEADRFARVVQHRIELLGQL